MKALNHAIFSCAALFLLSLSACGGGGKVKDVIDDITDVAQDPPRRTINTSIMGVNAFANDQRFGSISSQFLEVRDTMRLQHARLLFAWNDQVQPNPAASPDFSFYDELLRSLPAGIDALIVVTGVPSWMSDPANWIENNPRRTFVERWVSQVVTRYGANPKIAGWQIWNEPNNASDPNNSTLELLNSPENYVEMLALASNASKQAAPSRLVLNAATTAINQNFPASVDYNRAMRDAGAQSLIDVWAIHYYGKQYENVVRPDGVGEFLNGLGVPIWITESGAQGVNAQLEYVERTWPYLLEQAPGIARIYYYQFTDATASATTYGLRNLDPAAPVSDLYIYLRDR